MRNAVKKYLSAIMTVVMLFGMAPVESYAQPTMPESTVIREYTPVSDISVPLGTAWDDLDLPAALTVTLEDEAEKDLPVTWASAPVYDGETTGAYVLTASFDDDYTMAEGVDAPTLTVTMEAPVTSPTAPAVIAAFTPFEGIYAELGTLPEDLALPETLSVTLDDNTSAEPEVEWNSMPEYDGNTLGDYLFTASFEDTYTLAEGVEAPTLNVTVADSVTLMALGAPPVDIMTMTSTAPDTVDTGVPFDVQFTIRTAQADVADPKLVISLPGTVEIQSFDGTSSSIGVNLDSAQKSAASTNSGTTTLTYDFKYANSVASTMEVTFPVRFCAYGGISNGEGFTITAALYNDTTVLDIKTVTRTVKNTWQMNPTLSGGERAVSKGGNVITKDEIFYKLLSTELYYQPYLQQNIYPQARRSEDVYPFTDIKIVMALPTCLTPGAGTDASDYVPMVSGETVTSGQFSYTYYEAYNDPVNSRTYKALVFTTAQENATMCDIATVGYNGYISVALPPILYKSQLTESDPMPYSSYQREYFSIATDGTRAYGRFTVKDGDVERTVVGKVYTSSYVQIEDIAQKYNVKGNNYRYTADLFSDTEEIYEICVENISGYPMKDALITFNFSDNKAGDSPLEYYEAEFVFGSHDFGTVTAYYKTNLNSAEQSRVMTAAANTLSFGAGEYITALRVIYERLPSGMDYAPLAKLKLRLLADGTYTTDEYHTLSAVLSKPTFDGYEGSTTSVTAKFFTSCKYYVRETVPVEFNLSNQTNSDVIIGGSVYIQISMGVYNKMVEDPEFYVVMPNEYQFKSFNWAGTGYSFTTAPWDESHTLYSVIYSGGGKPSYISLGMYFTVGPTANIQVTPQYVPTAFYSINNSQRHPVSGKYFEPIPAEDQAKFATATGDGHAQLFKYTGINKTTVNFKSIGTFNTQSAVGVIGGVEGTSALMRVMDSGYYRLYLANQLSNGTNMTNFHTVITIPKDGGTTAVGDSSSYNNTLSLVMNGAAYGSGVFSGATFTYSSDGTSFAAASAISDWTSVTHVKVELATVQIEGGATGYISLPLKPQYDAGTASSNRAYMCAHLEYTRDGNANDTYTASVIISPNYTKLSGSVYFDDDADGQRDSNETANPYGRVFLDKKNGSDEWDVYQNTDTVASFNTSLLLPGEYRLRYMLPSGSTSKFDTAHSQFTDTSVDTDGVSENEVATPAIIISNNTPISTLSGYSLGLQRSRVLSSSTDTLDLIYNQSLSANITVYSTPILHSGESITYSIADTANFTATGTGNTIRVSYIGGEPTEPVSTILTVSAPNTDAFGGAGNLVTHQITVRAMPNGCDYGDYDASFVLSNSYSGTITDVGVNPTVTIPYYSSNQSLYYKLDLVLAPATYCTTHSAYPSAKIEIIDGSSIASFYSASYTSAAAASHTGNVTLGGEYYYRVSFSGAGTVKLRATFSSPHNISNPTTVIERTITVVKQNRINFVLTAASDLICGGTPKPVTVTATNYNKSNEAFTDTTAYTVSYTKSGDTSFSGVPTEPGTYSAVITMTDTSVTAPYVKGSVTGATRFTILPNTSTLTVDPNGGTWGGKTASQSFVQSFNTTKVISIPTRTGYTFTGWTRTNTNGALSEPDTAGVRTYTYGVTNGATDTITAGWLANSYTVSYDGNKPATATGAVTGVSGSQSCTYNVAFNLGATPTLTGYTFAGWYKEAACTNMTGAAGAVVTNLTATDGTTVTLYAKWTANTDTAYVVEHYVMGTDGNYPTTATNTDNLTGISDSTLTLADLKKVSLEVTDGIAYTYGTADGTTATATTLAPDGTRLIKLYYARSEYELTTTAGTGISTGTGSDNFYYGADVTINATVSIGYTWEKWTSGDAALLPDSNTKEYTFTMPAGAVTISASATLNQYSVSYTAGQHGSITGSTSADYLTAYSDTLLPDTGYALPTAVTMTMGGTAFTDFTYDTATGGIAISARKILGDIVISGSCTPIVYTIGYTLDGGTVATANPTEYTVETAAITLNNPGRVGCTFTGWSGAGLTGGNNTTVTIANGSTGNRSYTAHWVKNSYAVTLSATEATTAGTPWVTPIFGSAMPTEDVTMPLRTGYTFKGYYDAVNGGTQYYTADGASAKTWDKAEAATLYAQWTANSYTVAYIGNGSTGGSMTPGAHTYDAVQALAANGFERRYTVTYNHNYPGSTNGSNTANYAFAGWNTVGDGTGENYTGGQSVVNLSSDDGASVPLYAQWTAASVTLPSPVRWNYTFRGWYTDANGGTFVGGGAGTYTPTVNTTLYAHWTLDTYGIFLSTTTDVTFRTESEEYSASTAHSVTVRNVGNQPTGYLTIALSGKDARDFVLSKTFVNDIAVNGSDSFTVVSNMGLTAGTYTATVTVSGGAAITEKSFNVSFTVMSPDLTAALIPTEEVRDEDVGGENETDNADGEVQTFDFYAGQIIVTVPSHDGVVVAELLDKQAIIDSVLAQEELEQVANGATVEIKLDVHIVHGDVPEDDKKLIETAIEEFGEEVPGLTLGSYIEISLSKRISGGEWQNIPDAGKLIEIVIHIPEQLPRSDTEFFVIRSHDGEYTILRDRDNNPDTVTILTQYFSTYAIAYRSLLSSASPCFLHWLVLGLAVAFALFSLLWRDEEKRRRVLSLLIVSLLMIDVALLGLITKGCTIGLFIAIGGILLGMGANAKHLFPRRKSTTNV